MSSVNEKKLLTIYETTDGYESEYISVEVDTNIPYHRWFDGGNMWGNRSLEMTWEQVENVDPIKFKGINGHNWKKYI